MKLINELSMAFNDNIIYFSISHMGWVPLTTGLSSYLASETTNILFGFIARKRKLS